MVAFRRLPHRGFTIIEILVVVAILAMLASVAVIQLLRARITTNEQLGLNSMRAVMKASQFYFIIQQRYPPDLTALGLPASNPPYIQPDLIGNGSTVAKQGYVFTYTQVGGGSGFTLLADPQTAGTTGTRHFYVDQGGVIHQDPSGPADPTDPSVP